MYTVVSWPSAQGLLKVTRNWAVRRSSVVHTARTSAGGAEGAVGGSAAGGWVARQWRSNLWIGTMHTAHTQPNDQGPRGGAAQARFGGGGLLIDGGGAAQGRQRWRDRRGAGPSLTGAEERGFGHVDGHLVAELGDVGAKGFLPDVGEPGTVGAPCLPHARGAIVGGDRRSQADGCAKQYEDCEAPHGWGLRLFSTGG